jgi:methylmalonyl-CoA epimerase
MIKGFYGVSIAVKDLDEAAKKYSEVLGMEPVTYKPEELAMPCLKGVRFRVGDVTISLIASEQPNTAVAKFVETRGEGIFLASLEVSDVEQDMKELVAKGVQMVVDKPIDTASGKLVFGHPKSMHGVQFEFIQPKSG